MTVGSEEELACLAELEDSRGEREEDGGEEEGELGGEQDLLEVVEEAAERGAGDLAEEREVGLLAERGGGHVVGGAVGEESGGHLLGVAVGGGGGRGGGGGVEESGGGGVHADTPPLLLCANSGAAPVGKRGAEGCVGPRVWSWSRACSYRHCLLGFAVHLPTVGGPCSSVTQLQLQLLALHRHTRRHRRRGYRNQITITAMQLPTGRPGLLLLLLLAGERRRAAAAGSSDANAMDLSSSHMEYSIREYVYTST